MADYGKKKNDELAALCKERGLAHTGKKADLVKRLEDHDTTNPTTATTAPAAAVSAVEDEIDWDEEPTVETATTQPAAAAIAASGIGEVANSSAVHNQTVVNPATNSGFADAVATQTEATAEPAAAEAPKVEDKDFSSGAAMRTLEEEIEKRKKRARKFGLPEDSEEIKTLERAKRFGNTDLPGLLNKALPERSDVRKRGSENLGSAEDGGIRKRSRGRGGPGRGRGRREDSALRNNGPARNGGGGDGGRASWMTAADREAAERRKARFAA